MMKEARNLIKKSMGYVGGFGVCYDLRGKKKERKKWTKDNFVKL